MAVGDDTHCFCEKPVSLTDTQIQDVLTKARRLCEETDRRDFSYLEDTVGTVAAIRAAVVLLHDPQDWLAVIGQVCEALVDAGSLDSAVQQFQLRTGTGG